MAVLDNLEPKSVFKFFEEICGIPHGSRNTKMISDYLKNFADERDLECYQDSLNNIIIIKEATEGYENSEPVIIQGHMDMVCEKAVDCTKDMEKEPLDLVVDGDIIYAEGTTLGGDDGIAVAMALAILDADDIPHPRVEVIITVDEEIGMLGAIDINVDMIKGRRMLNLDCEDEGVFTVSCAGGNVTACTLPVKREAHDGKTVSVKVLGLQGGHSGIEINKGRGNSNLIMGRVLTACDAATDVRLISVAGGLKDNAIPRETTALLSVSSVEQIKEACGRLEAELKEEYSLTDAGISIEVAEVSGSEMLPMDEDSTERVITFLTCAPNGIMEMSAGIEGLVQTSLNAGIVKTDEKEFTAAFCLRSSMDSQKQMMVERLERFTKLFGGSIAISGSYSGWAYRNDSPLRDLLCEVYREHSGKEPKIEAIHAGVECGIFAGKLPGLDCVAFGPDLKEIHTCGEKMHIGSVQRVWKLVIETIRRMK